MFDSDEWDNTAKNAHVIWDAESESMDTSDRSKNESNAQTMSFALRQQSRYPSLGVPRFHYNANTGIPSAPPMTEEERERWPEKDPTAGPRVGEGKDGPRHRLASRRTAVPHSHHEHSKAAHPKSYRRRNQRASQGWALCG